MERITIIGATGRLGSWLTKTALEKGYKVRAVMRDPSNVRTESPELEIFPADARELEAMKLAVQNSFAVISTVGDRNLNEESSLTTDVINTIILALKDYPETRLIAVGGEGILQADENALISEKEDYPPFLKNVAQDHFRKWKLLEASNLPWTLVCPPQILPTFATGNFKTKENYPAGGATITSGDLADFIIHELKENKFLRKRVGISN